MADPIAPQPVFRRALAGETTGPRDAGSVSFADLVRMLAESIADAQLALDRTSAEMVAQLASTPVDIVPRVTERVAADGTISYEHDKPRSVSLLDLGVRPTFYQFSQATVEVTMDLHVVENVETTEKGTRRVGLFAGTQEVQTDRAFNRDMRATSKVTATLVPVPGPSRLDPARSTVRED